jgi:Uma2 family endonuclease
MPQQRTEVLKSEHYTYANVLEWDENVRAEIIDGELYMMAPPSTVHQRISRELFGQLYNYLDGKPCEAFTAPFGVRLFPQEDKTDDIFVEPDIVVVCDPSKLDDWGCNGAPDLIIEIISPTNSRHDRFVKFQKYLAAGVREYWIVDPNEQTVQTHVLDTGRYVTAVYGQSDEVPVTVLPGCVINLARVFSR